MDAKNAAIEVIARITETKREEIGRYLRESRYKVVRIRKTPKKIRTLMIPEAVVVIRSDSGNERRVSYYSNEERKIIKRSIKDGETYSEEGLRFFQSRLLKSFLYRFPVSRHAFCSIPERSVETCIAPHENSLHFFETDFKDAFPSVNSVTIAKVIANSVANGPILPFVGRCDEEIAKEIGNLVALLTTFDDQLPQGAPCSPYLFNLVCFAFDREMVMYAKEKGLKFTRYADNVIVSSHHPITDDDVAFTVRAAVEHGFTIHPEKTRLVSWNFAFAPLILGVRITNGALKIPLKKVEKYRAAIYKATMDELVDVGEVFGILSWVLGIEKSIPNRMKVPLRNFLMARCPDKLPDYAKYLVLPKRSESPY